MAYINLKQKLALAQLIQDEFVKRAQGDTDFAAWASETLGFKVDPLQAHRMRRQLGISATHAKGNGRGAKKAAMEKRIRALELEVASLKRAITSPHLDTLPIQPLGNGELRSLQAA